MAPSAVRRLMQGREPFRRERRGVGTVGEQQVDHRLVAEGAGQMQGHEAVGCPCRGVGTALQGVERQVFVAGEGRPQQSPVDFGRFFLGRRSDSPGEEQGEIDRSE
jgi:hypothetical protein